MPPKPLVVLTDPFLPEIIARELKPWARVRIARSRAKLTALLPLAEGLLVTLNDRIDDTLLARAPRLRAVANYAVGVNNVDLAACARRGVRVVNTPEVLTRATAELALALLLACARRVPEGERMCREGRFGGWDPRMLLGVELRGRHAVVVGQGRIGQETARLFRGVGLTTEFVAHGDSAREVTAKLRRAQVLSLHVPLTPETRHWLDARRLALLPEDAILINTARGPVVDERALIAALKKNRIFAAGLDVYEREPAIPAALRKLPNTVLLPHLGSATREARAAMAVLAISGLLSLLGGGHPPNEVTLPR